MAETAPTCPTSPLKTPGDLDSGVSGDSVCGGGGPAMLDRIGSNKASNNISSRSNSPSSPPTSPRPPIRSNAAAGSPLRNEVQDVRMGVWHTHTYDSPFTATIDGLQQFWDAWTALVIIHEANFEAAVVQEVQSENVQREIAEWTAQSHCPRRESLCEDILSKAGDNPNHTVRGLVRLRSFNDLKELEQLPKVLIRSLEEAAETEKTEEQEAALGAAAAGGSTTLAPPSPSTATVAQPQPPFVSPPSSTLPAPASTSPSNSPTPPRRISSATVSSYPSSAAALAVSSSRMAAIPRSQSVPHGLGNGLCKGESKQKPKQAKKGGCKGMTGLAKAKHDLLTFVTAKHRRFSYSTAQMKASNRAKKEVTERLRKKSIALPMLVKSETELCEEQARLVSKYADCLRQSDHVPIAATVWLPSASGQHAGSHGGAGAGGTDGSHCVRVVSHNIQEFVEDGLNIYAGAMPFLKGTKGSGKLKQLVSAMMSQVVIEAHAEAVVRLCSRALEGTAAQNGVTTSDNHDGEQQQQQHGPGDATPDAGSSPAVAVCLQEVDPYVLDVLVSRGASRSPPWEVHACEDATTARGKAGGCLGITCIVSVHPFEPMPDIVVTSTGKGKKVRRFACVRFLAPASASLKQPNKTASSDASGGGSVECEGGEGEGGGGGEAPAILVPASDATLPLMVASVHVRHFDGVHAWPELKGVAALSAKGVGGGGERGSKRKKGHCGQPTNAANIAVAELMLRDAAAAVLSDGGVLVAVGDYNGPMRTKDGCGRSNAVQADDGDHLYTIVSKAIRKRKLSESNKVQDAAKDSKIATSAEESASGGGVATGSEVRNVEQASADTPPSTRPAHPFGSSTALVSQTAPDCPTQYGKASAIDGCMVISSQTVRVECSILSNR